MNLFFRTLIFVCIIYGCSNQMNEYTYLDRDAVFSVQDTIRGEILPMPIVANGIINRLYYTREGLLCCTVDMPEQSLQLLDTVSGTVLNAVGNEVFDVPYKSALFISFDFKYDKSLYYAYNRRNRLLLEIKTGIDTIYQTNKTPVPDNLMGAVALDGKYTYFTYMPDQHIRKINSSGDSLAGTSYRILDSPDIDFENYYVSAYINATPSRDKIVLTGSRFSSIKILEASNLKLLATSDYFEPLYYVQNGMVKLKGDHIVGGGTTKVTDKYIFIRTFGQYRKDEQQHNEGVKCTYVLQFDLTGKFIKSHLFAEKFYTFAVSPDNKTLYAMIKHSNEPHIIKYETKL